MGQATDQEPEPVHGRSGNQDQGSQSTKGARSLVLRASLVKEYLAHVVCDDGWECDLEVSAETPETAALAGFFKALEDGISPEKVTFVTEFN